MRKETKELLQSKLRNWNAEQTHALDPKGCWVHVRDIRSIINCETELLIKTIEKLKQQIEFLQKQNASE